MRSFFTTGHLSMATTTALLLLLPLLVDQASAFLGKQSSCTTSLLPAVTASRFEVMAMLRMAADAYAEEEELPEEEEPADFSSSTPAETTSFPAPPATDAAIAKVAAAAAPPSEITANTEWKKVRLYQDEMGNSSTEPPKPIQDTRKNWKYFTPVCGCYDSDETWSMSTTSTTTGPKKSPQGKIMWNDFTQVFLNAGCDG